MRGTYQHIPYSILSSKYVLSSCFEADQRGCVRLQEKSIVWSGHYHRIFRLKLLTYISNILASLWTRTNINVYYWLRQIYKFDYHQTNTRSIFNTNSCCIWYVKGVLRINFRGDYSTILDALLWCLFFIYFYLRLSWKLYRSKD